MGLLKQMQQLAEPHLNELQPEELASLLQCYALFKACTPELWNGVVAVLLQLPLESLSQGVLLQLYQVGVAEKLGLGLRRGSRPLIAGFWGL
jgi:hypothetical protein